MSLLGPMDDSQLDAIIEGLERIKKLEAEIARLRLTDAEREAMEVAARFMEKWGGVPNTITSDTIRGLLERLK